MKKEKNGVLKEKNNIKSKITQAGIALGIFSAVAVNVALYKPQAYNAEISYDKKMQTAHKDYKDYVDVYGDDIQNIIEKTTKKNINMESLEKELIVYFAEKYKKEAQDPDKVIEEYNNNVKERIINFGKLTLVTAVAGAMVGGALGSAIGGMAQGVSNKVQAIKNKSGRKKEGDELEPFDFTKLDNNRVDNNADNEMTR